MEVVEQFEVALALHVLRQFDAEVTPLSEQPRPQVWVAVCYGISVHLPQAEAIGQNVGVTHLTQPAPDPLEFSRRVIQPHRIEERAIGLEVRAQPSTRHPGLVHGPHRRICGVESQAVVVVQNAVQAVGDARLHDVLQGGTTTDSTLPASCTRSAWAERLFKFLFSFRARTGLAKFLEERIDQIVMIRRGEVISEFELDLTETPPSFRPMGDRDQVIVDLPQFGPFAISQHHAAPEGLEDDDAAQHRASDGTLENPGCLRRHLFPHPSPRQFQAIERVVSAFLRQLHRPLAGVTLLALSMPQRDPPLPEPQVRGIEIGRVQRLLWQPEGGTCNLGQVGQLKADVHRELHLAFEVFGVWRHCALSTPLTV